ncbi:hypothetical protein H4Q26_007150 [Puccinia striiformis f. sp. tritici PST-130]|nr:hypothetical protein H4Q26_007150 [Puccinia striiformis f. sp. tritici PST-130]
MARRKKPRGTSPTEPQPTSDTEDIQTPNATQGTSDIPVAVETTQSSIPSLGRDSEASTEPNPKRRKTTSDVVVFKSSLSLAFVRAINHPEIFTGSKVIAPQIRRPRGNYSRTDSSLSKELSIAPIASVNHNLLYLKDQGYRFRIKIDLLLSFSFFSKCYQRGTGGAKRFTLEDFEHLLLSWSEKENISPAEDYQFFCDSLEPIMSYLLRNDDIGTKELQNIYYQAFSQVLQCSLHRSRSALNEDCIRLKIEYQGTTDNSPLLESCSTFFKDVIATTSVPELEERNLDAELEPSEQSIQDSGETVVPLSIPAPSATDPSLFQSEACVKKVVENNYLDVLDNGLGEIPNVIVSDVVVTDSLKEFNAPVSDFALGCYSNRLGFLTRPIPEDRPGEVAMFRERILPLDPTECQIKMPVSSSQVKNDLEGLEDSAGLGDDHNHFIDRRDSSDINFNVDLSAFDITLTQDHQTRCFPNRISTPSVCYRLGPLSLGLATLTNKNELPSEEDAVFFDRCLVFQLESDQVQSFQVSPFQGPLEDGLREEGELLMYRGEQGVDSIQPSREQLSQAFQDPALSFQDHLRDEDKLDLLIQSKEVAEDDDPILNYALSRKLGPRISLSTQIHSAQERLLMLINDIERISTFIALISPFGSLDHPLSFSSQKNSIDSLVPISSDYPFLSALSNEADYSLEWNWTGLLNH